MRKTAPLLSIVLLMWCTNVLADEIQDWIDDQANQSDFTAISAAYMKDGQVTHYAGGRIAPDDDTTPDAETQFEIGSITKSFTDLLLAEMVEGGLIRYDTTLRDILGDEIDFSNGAVGDITLLQLATHTSGLPRLPANFAPSDPTDPYKDFDEAALFAGLAMARDQQPLGDHYGYSNFGVGILGYLLGRVHGSDYVTALTERVLEPLGMDASGFEIDAGSATPYRGGSVVSNWSLDSLAGAGALRSTTNDLLRVARAMLGEADNPLSHDLEDNKQVLAPADGFAVTRVWHVADSPEGPVYWHNGGTGGFWSFFGFRPTTNEAIVILVSGDTNPTNFGLAQMAIDDPVPPAIDIDESVFGQYELTAALGIGVYEVSGFLVAQVSGQPPAGLHPVGDDWYVIDVADASVRFVREGDEVVALELVQNGIVQNAARTADVADALARAEITLSQEQFGDYVGEFVINADAKFTIRVGEENLEVGLTGQAFYPVFAKGGDVFFYKVVDAELHFERDDNGAVNALVLHQGGIVQRAEKAN